MAAKIKRFRVENYLTEMGERLDNMPTSSEGIEKELREIRALIQLTAAGTSSARDMEVESLRSAVECYRAQIEQYEKLKEELNLIRVTIEKTKREIAVVHGRSFEDDRMAHELNEVVGGTEAATQSILSAAEAIDEAASALAKVTSADQRSQLSQDIQDRVVSIFEACNFQDLTGQRINKVMAMMEFIEQHINAMMEIWGGVEEIKQHAPAIMDDRIGDAQFLNGPRGANEEGHASQNDIDALFP